MKLQKNTEISGKNFKHFCKILLKEIVAMVFYKFAELYVAYIIKKHLKIAKCFRKLFLQ
jgi:hypothetical protein